MEFLHIGNNYLIFKAFEDRLCKDKDEKKY